MEIENNSGWKEWSKYVLKELERLNECYEKLDKKIDKITIDVSTLKTKAAVIGAVSGGLLSAIVAVIVWLITNKPS